MNLFLALAALMAGIAAAAVAWPLMRRRPGTGARSRIAGVLAAVFIVAAAAGLYPLWSNWDWNAAAQAPPAGPDVAAMVGTLERRLKDKPDDLQGWLMLGRSYVALQRVEDAVAAYDHARRLDANSAEAVLGLGEAISLRAGGEITPAAAEMFEKALVLEPNNPKALLYGGFAAAGRGEKALARSRWEALKNLNPPPQIVAMLDARIADLGLGGSAAPVPAGGSAAASGPPGEATISLSIAPALKSRLKGDAPLFVFAREPGSHGPPLAAKRLTSAAIGSQIHLSGADSMLPGRVLVSGQTVSITARVSFSGQPTPAAGDLYGELSYDVGHDGVRDLVIDRVAE